MVININKTYKYIINIQHAVTKNNITYNNNNYIIGKSTTFFCILITTIHDLQMFNIPAHCTFLCLS